MWHFTSRADNITGSQKIKWARTKEWNIWDPTPWGNLEQSNSARPIFVGSYFVKVKFRNKFSKFFKIIPFISKNTHSTLISARNVEKWNPKIVLFVKKTDQMETIIKFPARIFFPMQTLPALNFFPSFYQIFSEIYPAERQTCLSHTAYNPQTTSNSTLSPRHTNLIIGLVHGARSLYHPVHTPLPQKTTKKPTPSSLKNLDGSKFCKFTITEIWTWPKLLMGGGNPPNIKPPALHLGRNFKDLRVGGFTFFVGGFISGGKNIMFLTKNKGIPNFLYRFAPI